MSADEAHPGWAAIDAELGRLYPGQEARHVAYIPPAAISDNLQGCSAYAAEGHWHYVTYGLSNLYDREPGPVPDWSGWGFELSFRVARGAETEAPGWPFTLLNQIANYINGQGVPVEAGEWMDWQRPITGHPHTDGPGTGLTAMAFTLDPQLGEISTPNGKVGFHQAVGITDAEKSEMRESGVGRVLARLSAGNALLVTDPARCRE